MEVSDVTCCMVSSTRRQHLLGGRLFIIFSHRYQDISNRIGKIAGFEIGFSRTAKIEIELDSEHKPRPIRLSDSEIGALTELI
jgi:hypothetical protein